MANWATCTLPQISRSLEYKFRVSVASLWIESDWWNTFIFYLVVPSTTALRVHSISFMHHILFDRQEKYVVKKNKILVMSFSIPPIISIRQPFIMVTWCNHYSGKNGQVEMHLVQDQRCYRGTLSMGNGWLLREAFWDLICKEVAVLFGIPAIVAQLIAVPATRVKNECRDRTISFISLDSVVVISSFIVIGWRTRPPTSSYESNMLLLWYVTICYVWVFCESASISWIILCMSLMLCFVTRGDGSFIGSRILRFRWVYSCGNRMCRVEKLGADKRREHNCQDFWINSRRDYVRCA